MPAQQSTVLFSPATRRAGRRPLREFARLLQSEVAAGRPFDVLIADDAELERLNRLFRKRPYPTDVLSFGSGKEDGFLGEIAISELRALVQAKEQGHSKDCELRILMLHLSLIHI